MDIIKKYIEENLASLLAEDFGKGDITTLACLESIPVRAEISAKSSGILAGLTIAEAVFKRLDPDLEFIAQKRDGGAFRTGDIIAELKGMNNAVLSGERLALNMLGHLSGIATVTASYVERIKGTGAVILDTRKTIPGLRIPAKYAVKCGGGENHRMGLHDMILIKDNHIAAAGSIGAAVTRARGYLNGSEIRNNLKFTDHEIGKIVIEVEVETEEQLIETVRAGVKRILLDNQSPEQLRKMVEKARSLAGDLKLEASGGITLDNVRTISETGVDYISVGALTHSARSSDFSLNIVS